MSDSTPTLVLASVWIAVACMPAGLLLRLDRVRWVLWRGVWSLGAASFLVHTVSAYALVYGWSQAVALEETRRQTEAATGFDSGTGLYPNLLFAALWTFDGTRTWLQPRAVRGEVTGPSLMLHGFLTFMLMNGAFVFVVGPQRWFGFIVSILVLSLWVLAWRRRRRKETAP